MDPIIQEEVLGQLLCGHILALASTIYIVQLLDHQGAPESRGELLPSLRSPDRKQGSKSQPWGENDAQVTVTRLAPPYQDAGRGQGESMFYKHIIGGHRPQCLPLSSIQERGCSNSQRAVRGLEKDDKGHSRGRYEA